MSGGADEPLSDCGCLTGGNAVPPPKIEKILRVMPGVSTDSGFTVGDDVAVGPRHEKLAAKIPPPFSGPVRIVPKIGTALSAAFNA